MRDFDSSYGTFIIFFWGGGGGGVPGGKREEKEGGGGYTEVKWRVKDCVDFFILEI